MKYFSMVLALAFILTVPQVMAEGEAHSGSYAAYLEWTNQWESGMDSGLDRVGAYLPVQGGHDYTLSVWVRGGNEEVTDMFRCTFADFDESDNWLGDDAQDVTSTTNEWQKYDYTHTAEADAQTLNVAFRIFNTNGGAIIMDDVTFQDDTLTSAITVSNGGFENWPGDGATAPPDWRFFEAGGAEGAIIRVEEEAPTPPATAADESCWRMYK